MQRGGRCRSCNDKKWPRRQFSGSQLWQSHPLSCSAPTQGSGWVHCTRQPRATELPNARLCSMIHYSELLNNSAGRINGICHRNTFHMEASSLSSISLQRQQLISPHSKLMWWQGLLRSMTTEKLWAFRGPLPSETGLVQASSHIPINNRTEGDNKFRR